ncbi:hypothetical protein BN2475_590055 [Paraburkholderia ribeironis]|uniref:Uncharacterized protein n=1 Tax=Paraburkholderia ribeironis TaxID=1247936 RepID=A0A1N7SEQ6_9BURK|nr:hypothetical protein BN2475_590055 [Paraburkholderia ribeironis]
MLLPRRLGRLGLLGLRRPLGRRSQRLSKAPRRPLMGSALYERSMGTRRKRPTRVNSR